MRATGTFDVTITPQSSDPAPEGAQLGRMSLDKSFHGDLSGTGKGEMLTVAAKTSAAYSAVERITGTLHGKKGSFALQHTGVMNRGTPSLTITVVPDSGTNELNGLTGTMDIVNDGKKHSYVLNYEIRSS